MEYFLFALGAIALLLWISGFVKILTSDNINLIKIFMIFLSFSIPPFPIFYLFKSIFLNELKNAPEKIIDNAIVTGEITAKAAKATAKFLLKK